MPLPAASQGGTLLGKSIPHPLRRPLWDGLLVQLMNATRTGGRMENAPAEHPEQQYRSWQQIAAELSQETNADNVVNLSEELNRALEKNEKRRNRAAA